MKKTMEFNQNAQKISKSTNENANCTCESCMWKHLPAVLLNPIIAFAIIRATAAAPVTAKIKAAQCGVLFSEQKINSPSFF